MDDEAALRARRVALAASAWLRVPADAVAYARLVEAVHAWDDYRDPRIEEQGEDLLDELAETDPCRPPRWVRTTASRWLTTVSR